MGKILTLAEQFDFYLKKVNLKKESMSHVQYTETRRAWYGGVGQILTTSRDDITELPEKEAIIQLERWWQECNRFWENEVKDPDRLRDYHDG